MPIFKKKKYTVKATTPMGKGGLIKRNLSKAEASGLQKSYLKRGLTVSMKKQSILPPIT